MSHNALACVVLGAGGHARVVIDAMQAGASARPVAALDANQALWGTNVLGVPVLGGDERLSQLAQQQIRHFVIGVGGVGDNQPRRQLFERAMRAGLRPLIVRHPSAVCSSWAIIGDGCVLLPGSVVNAGACLGVNVIVNSGAIIEHDCRIGSHVHVATRAVLAGAVSVESLAHLGAGAVVRQHLSIGEGAIVGAGAVVVTDVQPWTVVTGVPARVMEQATA